MNYLRLFGIVGCITFLLLSLPAMSQDMDELRTQLQEAMFKARQAVLKKNYEKFQKAVYPRDNIQALNEDVWMHSVNDEHTNKVLLSAFPDLIHHARFLKIKQAEKWAVYYAEINTNDSEYQTVAATLFQKRDGHWLPFGKGYNYTKARPDSDAEKSGVLAWKDKSEMMQIIETKPEFQINFLTAD